MISRMWSMNMVLLLLPTILLVSLVHGDNKPIGLKANNSSRTTMASESRTTTANEIYPWNPRDPGDTLWFTTNGTGISLTIAYKGPQNRIIQLTPSTYNITEKGSWNRVIYKGEQGKYITICPDHNFQSGATDPALGIEINFKHRTGKIKWSTTIPDFEKPIKIKSEDITLFTGEHKEDEGPEKLFGVPGKWKPTGLPVNYNNWSVTVDLKETYTLTKLSLKLQGNNKTDAKSFKLELSTDEGAMTEIFNVTSVKTGVKDALKFQLPSGSTGRFCRFTVTETVNGEAPIIQDLGFFGYTECQTSSIRDGRIVNTNANTTAVSTIVYTDKIESTLHCNQNESTSCHKPKGTNEKVCTTNHVEICEDTLVCENITKKVCTSSSEDATPVCSDSTETQCKTSTKDYFDEEGCATLNSDQSYLLITSLVINSILVLVIIVLAILIFTQTGCVCNKRNYRKQSLGPPTRAPTPPPLVNPVLNRIIGNGTVNPRHSDHLYDSPYEFPEHLERRDSQEDPIPENTGSSRLSRHDSVNSFYAGFN